MKFYFRLGIRYVSRAVYAQSEARLTQEPEVPSGYILSFLLPLNQERQVPVNGESMCTKYWLPLMPSSHLACDEPTGPVDCP